MRTLFAMLALAGTCFAAMPGPYAPAAGQPGSTAIADNDERILRWATGVSAFARGYQDISGETEDVGFDLTAWGGANSAIGRADEDGANYEDPDAPRGVVSLGDGGSITLAFGQPFGNGPGPDLAVFENAFTDSFLELAFVEVSSDGTSFHRFPAISLTQTDIQAVQWDTTTLLDPTNIHNLAGKYRRGFGTPFDLAELAGIDDLDIMAITHVRIIDVVGSIDPLYARYDSLGNMINDPWRTPFENGGFDLDAVAVLNVPEPGALLCWFAGALALAVRRTRRA